MDELEFQRRADEALAALNRKLSEASESAGFEPEFHAGALAIEFDDPPAKFVVSPNTPVRQIWVSAHAKSFKLGWDEARHAFVLPETRQTLVEMIGEAIGQQLGQQIVL